MSEVGISPYLSWRRIVIALELLVTFVWGGAILIIGNALSGPFSSSKWLEMILIWVLAPLTVVAACVAFGETLVTRGKHIAGTAFVCLPLGMLGVAAIWSYPF